MEKSTEAPLRIDDHAFQVREELSRLLASPQFQNSERLKRFLEFIVEKRIEGDTDALKESVIGPSVFDRDIGFDPKQDPIVRVTARRLRDKLEDFYAKPGLTPSPISIRLPKGGYVPEWELGSVAPGPGIQTVPDRRLPWVTMLFGAAALFVATVYVFRSGEPPSPGLGPVSRFTINLGPNQELRQYYGNNLAFSPDGRSLAYVAYQNDIPRLMIRSLGETGSRPVAGSEDARAPLFSADGQSIVAYVPGHLKRFFLAGGEQELVSVSPQLSLFGSAWDRETLLYDDAPSGSANAGFSSVFRLLPRSGQRPDGLSGRESPEGVGESEMIQQALPDGRGYLLSLHGDKERIATIPRQGGKRKILLENARGALYLPGGYLTFWSDGVLKAVPLSLPQMQLTGPQVSVVPKVGFSGWEGAEMAVSPQGTLAYVERASPVSDRQLTWVDHTGRQTPLPIPPAPIEPLNISPDGHNLLLARFDPGEQRWTLWNYSMVQGTSLQLTQPLRNQPYACWLSDGLSVAYTKRIAEGPSNLFIRPAHGSPDSPEQQLTHFQDAGVVPYTCSRDRQWLITTRGMLPATKSDIIAVPLQDNGIPEAVTAGPDYEFNPDLSADGRWIAYQTETDIYVRAFPPDAASKPIRVGAGSGPMWDPLGKVLYFFRGHKIMAIPVRFDPDPRFGTANVMFEANAKVMTPDLWIRNTLLSPDGKRFLMTFAERDETEGHRIDVVVNWFTELHGFFHPQH